MKKSLEQDLRDWFLQYEVSGPESFCQVDSINQDLPELGELIGEHIGYPEYDDDSDSMHWPPPSVEREEAQARNDCYESVRDAVQKYDGEDLEPQQVWERVSLVLREHQNLLQQLSLIQASGRCGSDVMDLERIEAWARELGWVEHA